MLQRKLQLPNSTLYLVTPVLPLLCSGHRFCARLSHQALCGIEEIDGGVAVGDEDRRKPQAPKKLGLHLGPSLRDALDGVRADGLDRLAELLRLDPRELLQARDLELVLPLLVVELRLVLLLLLLELTLGLDLPRLALELGVLQHCLHLDLCGLSAGAGLGLGKPTRLYCRGLCLELQQVLSGPLGGDLVLELLPLQEALGLLPLALGVVPGRLLLAFGGDLDGLLH
mmetsp:Transcript_32047/g.81601  ORF Transcript_32047/g.81601 Transcript_32047/m.81601 type:complete len:227 (-) Transcript_32047:2173-2853(-)